MIGKVLPLENNGRGVWTGQGTAGFYYMSLSATAAPASPRGIWFKTPSGCLKRRMASKPIYTMFWSDNLDGY